MKLVGADGATAGRDAKSTDLKDGVKVGRRGETAY